MDKKRSDAVAKNAVGCGTRIFEKCSVAVKKQSKDQGAQESAKLRTETTVAFGLCRRTRLGTNTMAKHVAHNGKDRARSKKTRRESLYQDPPSRQKRDWYVPGTDRCSITTRLSGFMRKPVDSLRNPAMSTIGSHDQPGNYFQTEWVEQHLVPCW